MVRFVRIIIMADVKSEEGGGEGEALTSGLFFMFMRIVWRNRRGLVGVLLTILEGGVEG